MIGEKISKRNLADAATVTSLMLGTTGANTALLSMASNGLRFGDTLDKAGDAISGRADLATLVSLPLLPTTLLYYAKNVAADANMLSYLIAPTSPTVKITGPFL